MGKHEKKQAGRQGSSQEQPKTEREIMTEKDNQEGSLISLGGQGGKRQPRAAPEGKSWETAATSKSQIMRGDKLGRRPDFRKQEPSH